MIDTSWNFYDLDCLLNHELASKPPTYSEVKFDRKFGNLNSIYGSRLKVYLLVKNDCSPPEGET